ncbi:MAG: ABC transporter ATP-binding protein [Chloroflexota bacterium]
MIHQHASSAVEAVVTVRDVSRIYGEGHGAVTALRKVTFEVSSGSLVAVTGRSGSGKTTLLNLIGGIDTPSSGTILLDGRDITRLTEHERTTLRRHGIAFIFQSFALLPTLSALENVVLALHIAGVPPRERVRRGREVLRLVGLGDRVDHRPYELSGGEQERVAIARALAGKAPLILADEPTGELDTATGRDVIDLLAEVVRTQHVAVIVATHDPAVVAAADRAYGLVDGILQCLEERHANGTER